MYDLVIRNGRVVDGSGMPAYNADIALSGNRIAKIGRIAEKGRKEIDAEGKVVSPGFIDPHTHFDAQLLWDGYAKPALSHGVTTIVPGNCSLSLAPLRAEFRTKLVGMFNQIEEMPLKAFKEGVVWDWETFSEYITRIRKGLAINVAPLVGHSVIRLWVMGAAAMERTATPEEITAMQGVLRECLDAGAIGLSTSYVDMDEKLQPVPSRYADAAEVEAFASVLGEYGRILQIVPEFYDADLTIARLDQLAEISLKYAIPTTFSPLFVNADNVDAIDRVMRRVDEQFARGARVWPQVQTRPIDISFCFAVPSLLFIRLPGWYRIMRFGTPDQIVAAFKDPATREKLVAESAVYNALWPKLRLRLVQTEANQKYVGMTVGEIAAATLKAHSLIGPVAVVELRLDQLDFSIAAERRLVRPSDFPAVERDLNLVVDEQVPWAGIAAAIHAAAGPLLEQCRLVQVWQDAERLGAGKKSVVVSLRLRSDSGTLSGDEAARVVEAVVAECGRRVGAALR